MNRFVVSAALIPLLALPLLADDKAKVGSNPGPSAIEKVKADADDTEALNAYMRETVTSLRNLVDDEKYDAAEKKLSELREFLATLKPQAAAAKRMLAQANSFASDFGESIEVARTPLADLEKQFEARPEDEGAFNKYLAKATGAIYEQSADDPDQAQAALKAARQLVEKLSAAATSDDVKKRLDGSKRQFNGLERAIESSRQLLALVGKDAESLSAGHIDTWVNGNPLTDADLKGKVVLLDFWAVWCGPCIATFPHLKEWNEKYAERGLVMIGMTQYYNYEWDDAAGRAKRSQGKVATSDEQEMLMKFAEQHELKHRFAVQGEASSLAKYYGVSGIPHVVVIDQEGKIRLIRVGSGKANAKAIGELLEKLLASK